MLEEIFQIPKVAKKIVEEIEVEREFTDMLSNSREIFLVGCGSSYYAAIAVKYTVQSFFRILSVAIPSSEFITYHSSLLDERDTVIGFSRSGETTETVRVMDCRARKIAVTSNKKSTMAKKSNFVLNTMAGEEKSIVMTKTYVAAIFAPMKMLSDVAGIDISDIPDMIKEVLGYEKDIKSIAKEVAGYRNFYYIGSGFSYATALEGSLKLKETTYLHAEAYPSGEVRHGPIALADKELFCIVINPKGRAY